MQKGHDFQLPQILLLSSLHFDAKQAKEEWRLMTTLQEEDDFGAAELRRRQDVARKLRLQVDNDGQWWSMMMVHDGPWSSGGNALMVNKSQNHSNKKRWQK